MSTGESRKYHFFVIFAAKRFQRVRVALEYPKRAPLLLPLLGGDFLLPRLWRGKGRPTRAPPRTTPSVAADSAGDEPP